MANANSRKSVQAAATRANLARRAELDAVRQVMADPRGRAFVWRLLTKTGCEGVVQVVPNAMQLAADVATQNVGKFVLLEVRAACPQLEVTMRQEAAAAVSLAKQQEELDDGHSDTRD